MAESPDIKKFANCGEAVKAGKEHSFHPEPCQQPTDARPGSKRKLKILAKRAENGEELFADGDRNALLNDSEIATGPATPSSVMVEYHKFLPAKQRAKRI